MLVPLPRSHVSHVPYPRPFPWTLSDLLGPVPLGSAAAFEIRSPARRKSRKSYLGRPSPSHPVPNLPLFFLLLVFFVLISLRLPEVDSVFFLSQAIPNPSVIHPRLPGPRPLFVTVETQFFTRLFFLAALNIVDVTRAGPIAALLIEISQSSALRVKLSRTNREI